MIPKSMILNQCFRQRILFNWNMLPFVIYLYMLPSAMIYFAWLKLAFKKKHAILGAVFVNRIAT